MPDVQVTDEMLTALADGELEPAVATRLRSRINRDAALAARFAALVETRALVEPGAALPTSAADEALAARLLGLDAELARPAERPHLRVVDGAGGRGDRARPPARRFAAPTALAASLALAVGLAGGLLLARLVPGPSDRLAFGAAVPPAIGGVLAAAPSGTETTIDGSRLAVLATHRIEGGALCREYELTSSAEVRTVVACRSGNAWRAELTVVRPAESSEGFRPASGGAALAEQFLIGLGSPGPLSPAEEKAALTP